MACHPGLNTGVSFTVLLTPSPARDNLITFYNQNREEVNCDFEKEEEEEKSLNMWGFFSCPCLVMLLQTVFCFKMFFDESSVSFVCVTFDRDLQ